MEVSAVLALVAASDSDLLAQMMVIKSYDQMEDSYRMESLSAVFAAKMKLLWFQSFMRLWLLLARLINRHDVVLCE